MVEKKKVLYIIHDLKIGGVETAILSAIPILVERYEFRLVCLGVIDNNIKKQLNTKELFSILEFSPYNPIGFLRALQFIKRFNPDLMISSLWRANMLGAIAKFLNKHLCFISFNHSTKLAHAAEYIIQKFSVEMAMEVWTDSQSTADFLKTRYKLISTPTIISFVLRYVQPVHINFDKIKIHKFLFVGRLISIKRIDLILFFAERLAERKVEYQIDIYGPDEDETWHKYKPIINEKKLNITYNGPRPYKELAYIYEKYHHYVQFSDYEGMSISVLEAMMSGLICFVRPVGEIQNYSTHLINAIHLKDISDIGRDKFMNDSYSILMDPERMFQISKHAQMKWDKVLLYEKDLCLNIDRVITSYQFP